MGEVSSGRRPLALTVVVAGALLASGCSTTNGPPPPSAPPTTVEPRALHTLAKVDGWQEGLDAEDDFAVLELAYDADSARALWEDTVDDGLPAAQGLPLQPGVYGSLDDVDWDTSVVGLFSSGESGSCPGWVEGIRLGDDGTVDIVTTEDMGGGDACTADYHFYRLVLAIDRDHVPEPDALPSARGTVDGPGILTAQLLEYPVSPSTPGG